MTTQAAAATSKWLLVFNCQTLGLANSLHLINRSLTVDHCDFSAFKKNPRQYLDHLDSYDLVLTAPQFLSTESGDLSAAGNTLVFPTVFFDGYHPDVCYLSSGSTLLKSPVGDYHSSLAFAGYRLGLDVDATRRLFCGRIYQALGYLDGWQAAKKALLDSFRDCGIDLSAPFQRWSSIGHFMHGINHPDIRCLHDVARALIRSQGLAEECVDLLPHDNLLNGAIFPVYDEIAERYSIKGSYRFKLAGEYRQIPLDEFIRASFRIYEQHDAGKLGLAPAYQALQERIAAVIQGQRP